ncbi:MAG: hypothetical protein O3B87_02350 [bacterium]|nr:hypothetical protein [bacterium]
MDDHINPFKYFLETFNPTIFKRRFPTLRFLLQRSWGAWIAFAAFIFFFSTQGYAFAGLFIIISAVMAMNGLAKTDLVLAHRTPAWWKKHPTLKVLHFINSEGEMAGIFIGVLTLIVIGLVNPQDLSRIHWPIGEVFTLYGIMSFANWTVHHMVTIMTIVEKYTGKFGVIFLGSLLSALTGEPAAAVFLSEYLGDRVTPQNKAKLATTLAGSIGSGGGWLPFSAPPILIIWGILSHEFGWSILDLMLFIGLGCVTHAFIVSLIARKYIKDPEEKLSIKYLKSALYTFGFLGALVLAHIFAHGPFLWLMDAVIGINVSFTLAQLYKDRLTALVIAKKLNTEEMRRQDDEYEHMAEKAFSSTFQPMLLAFLLLALEVIGHAAEPFIEIIAETIPESWPLLVTGLFLFYVTAVVSHFADNALASRVFIVVAVAFMGHLGAAAGNFLAIAVVYGALFGGFLMIPANLPNFAISRAFHVDAGRWMKNAIGLYWTGIVYVGALILWSILLIR